MAVTDKIFIGQ